MAPRATTTTAARHYAAHSLQPADRPAPGEAPPAWVPLSAGAERVSLCERTLRRAISAGELPGYRFGKALRVRLDELDAWAMSKAMPNPRTMRPVKAGGVR